MTFSVTRLSSPGANVKLRMVPGLNIAALQQRLDKPLFLYYCLRAIDEKGDGKLERQQAITALKCQYGYKRQTAEKHLHAGTGIFWRLHPCRDGRELIIYTGLTGLIKTLGASCRGDKLVEVDSIPASNRLQERRSLLYNVGAYQNLRAPISRQSLEDKTGITPRQQRTFDSTIERTGHKVRTRNLGYKKRDEKVSLHTREVDAGFTTAQIPNSYTAIHTGQHRGLLQKAQSSNRGEATARIYWTPHDFVRAVSRGTVSHGYVRESGRWVYQFA